jgi:hypothetical protein
MKKSQLQVLGNQIPSAGRFCYRFSMGKTIMNLLSYQEILPELAVDTVPFNILYKSFTSLIKSLILLDKLAFIILEHMHTYR